MPDPSFDKDPRDTSTPEVMAVLLDHIFSGKALQPDSTHALVGMMKRNRTGDARIRARLPGGTVVADKTGTLGGTVNDVGVITLKESAKSVSERESVIADIARSVYDFALIAAQTDW